MSESIPVEDQKSQNGELHYNITTHNAHDSFQENEGAIVIDEVTISADVMICGQTAKCLRNQGRTKGKGWSTEN